MKEEDKKLLLEEIKAYTKENYDRGNVLRGPELLLLTAIEYQFQNPKMAIYSLANNEYGLLGNLLYWHVLKPDQEVSQWIFTYDSQVIDEAYKHYGLKIIHKNNLSDSCRWMKYLIEKDPKAAHFIGYSLRRNREFMLEIAVSIPEIFKEAAEELRKDPVFSRQMVEVNSRCMEYIDYHLTSDREIAVAAISKEGTNLRFVDFSLRMDKDLVMQAIRQNPTALMFAPNHLQDDVEVVSLAVSIAPFAMTYASRRIRENPKILNLEEE